MSHINLLPWREKKRQQEQRQLMMYFLVGLCIAVGVVFLMHHQAIALVDRQRQRNQCLYHEITRFKQQIKSISEMKLLKQALLHKINIVQNLQETRTVTIQLLDELIKIIPKTVVLNRIECRREKVSLLGYAKSTTSISELMRNIAASVWILDPSLTEIKTTTADNEFKLNFIMNSKAIMSHNG